MHEYTPFQQHMRPFELLLLAGVMWWSLNHISRRHEFTRLSGTQEEPEADSKWDVPITVAKALAATIGYLLIVVAVFSVLEPEGLGWTLATVGAGLGLGTAGFLLVQRAGRGSAVTILRRPDDTGQTGDKN